ncbi:vacuolar protein sorting-associated protein 37D isoform X1 [Ambystoma mexicanum]|uniref:vacuolar protein sorting-associated protein 37D isoform X1 n=1 Tax=Ambystoma mexicanum TaxID=8296 RepID=UPI0037E81E09
MQPGWTRPPVYREMLPQPQLPRPPEPGPPPGGSLGTLSNAQLRELLGDERRLQRIVRLSGQVLSISSGQSRIVSPKAKMSFHGYPNNSYFQSLKTERNMHLSVNYSLARQNLALRPRLENGKANLAIKYQQLAEVVNTCRDRQRQLEMHLQTWNLPTALCSLQDELDAAEFESEENLQSFMEGSLPIDTFLETFQNSRQISHLRRTQLEKLQEVLEREPESPSPEQAELQGQESRNMTDNKPPRDQGPTAPRMCQLRYGLTPAFLIPAGAVAPFPVPSAPPNSNLPPLVSLPGPPQAPGHGLPYSGHHLRLIGHIPLLSPRPFRIQQLHHSQQQRQQPPKR